MIDLLKELIYEAILFKEKEILYENKKNKPPKSIVKGRSYKCIVRQTASKKFKKEVKKSHKNKKSVTVKVIEPDGRGDFSIIKFNKKEYMVKTSSLK